MIREEFKTNGDAERQHLFPALIKNHSRACLMSEEIPHLLKGGFPDAAFARWRSLYEIAVTATFIGLRGEACAEELLERHKEGRYHDRPSQWSDDEKGFHLTSSTFH